MDYLKRTDKNITIKEGYLPEVGDRKVYCRITNNAIKLYSIHPSITPTPIDERPIYYKDRYATKESLRIISFFCEEIGK